jgi:hypothetical protein
LASAWNASASARLDLSLALIAAGQHDEAAGATLEAITSGRIVPSNYWRSGKVLTRIGRSMNVAVVAAAEPAEQAAGILHTLGSLRPGRWWPGLDEAIETARGFYPGRLAEAARR